MAKANRVHSTPRRTASSRKAPPTKKSTPSQPARPAADPIWALIEKHRAERAAYAEVWEEGGKNASIDIPDGATDQVLAAGHRLLSTRPTTLAGVIALLRYVGSEQREENDLHEGAFPIYLPQKVDGEIWAYAFFETIADALSSGMNKIVAVTGAAVPEAMPSIAGSAPSSLIELGKRFDECVARCNHFLHMDTTGFSEAKVKARDDGLMEVFDKDDLFYAIGLAKAYTIEGLFVKARAVAIATRFDCWEEKSFEELDWGLQNTRMLIESIFRAAGPMTVEHYLELEFERAEG